VKYKAVIFDLFGTLVDNYDIIGYTSAIRETASILKIRAEDFTKHWQETAEKRFTGGFKTLEENLEYICKALDIPVKPFDIRLARMVRLDYVSTLLTPRRYAIEILAELKNSGYQLAIVSNCSTDVPLLWPQTPFAPFFNVLLFSSVAGFQKPHERIFLKALEELHAKPEECLYIDDNSNNLTAAAALGFPSVLITDAEGKEQEHFPEKPKGEWAALKIKELPEVLDILEGVHE
jgi:putative hydrolase of the HAD superfamily